MRPPSFGTYVHVPWCASRCPYCAFTVYIDRDPPFERWADTVLAEWALRRPRWQALLDRDGPPRSLYLGGGTPSLAPPEVLARVIAGLPHGPDTSISVELNPGTVTAERIADLKAAGARRMSLGVQTFTRRHARLLNRGHTVDQARQLVQLVAAAGLDSWNVDLIFAVPGQTMAELDADLDALLEAEPPHVSVYGLTFEPGTPLTRALEQGRIEELDEDSWRAMYERVVGRLGDAGLERYEVSNFGRPGHRSRHNDDVWRGGHYLGLGPSAHGYQPDGARTRGHLEWEAWVADPLGETDPPDPETSAIDLVLSTLRHIDGLDLAWLQAETGLRVSARVLDQLDKHGLCSLDGTTLRLTTEGFFLGDGVVREVVKGLEVAD